jgi:hypothetical protein
MRIRVFLITLVLSPLSVRATTSILVPAYFDPSDSTGWTTLISSVSTQVPITAIMNPDNGPVKTVDSSYTSAISQFQSAGGMVVGYVYTSNGSRSISTVEKNIATYESEYPNINGIFLDEMANTSSELSYYKTLYTYIKSENSKWQVIGNPGTDTLSTYLSPTPAAADELVTFENGSGYSTYTPPAWESSYNTSSFANIVYGVSGASAMESDLSLAATDHAGNIYFSDATGSNPYSALPSYWTQEVAAVRAINGPPLKGTYTLAASGDYNTAANWSAAIPNGINAEADFLGAITSSRTVYSDVAITAGKIVFNNANTYVLAGAGSLTLETTSGSALVDAQAGTQKITLPITIASSTTFNADAGATLLIAAPVTINPGQTLNETGTGTISIVGSVTLQGGASAGLLAGSSVQSLAIGAASSAAVIAPASQSSLALQTSGLSLGTGSVLDLQGNGLIVHNGDLSAIAALIQSGYASGKGIVSLSETAAASRFATLGIIANLDGGSAIYTSFDGAAVVESDVLVNSTVYGDTNLDGIVNASDYARIDTGFSNHLTGWYNGDFNYDGTINGSDYTLIDNAYNSSTPLDPTVAQITAEVASVPEPAMFVMLPFALLGMLHRRGRDHLRL